jgi:hypothetical protein
MARALNGEGRVSRTALVFAIAVAITGGAVLLAPGASVGAVRRAASPLRYAVIVDPGGVIVPGVELEPVAVEAPWGVDLVSEPRDDWSAFGAARAFVDMVGAEWAARALGRALARAAERAEVAS